MGVVHTSEAGRWSGIVEVTGDLTNKVGQLGYDVIANGGRDNHVPVRVLNVTKETINILSLQTLGEFTQILDGDVLVCSVTEQVKVESKRENPVTQVLVDSLLTADQNAKLLKLQNKHRVVFAGPDSERRSKTVTHRIP